uniref:Synaptotagmin 10 n=1 Tax=Mastacembelus armatus TaxID=205130 RepID=A0A7N8Y9M3_9TELE
MSVRTEDSITLCQRALQIITELCLTGNLDREKCSDIFPLESNGSTKHISISLLAVVVGFCGLALLVVSLFVFWKLCWPLWRSKALSAHAENGLHVAFPEAPPPSSPGVTKCKAAEVEKKNPPEVKVNGRSSVKILEAAMKISQTSPDIPAEVQTALKEKLSQQAKIQRQTTEPTSSSRLGSGETRQSKAPSCSHFLSVSRY